MTTWPEVAWWDIARIGKQMADTAFEQRDGIRYIYGLSLLALCSVTAPSSFARDAVEQIFGNSMAHEADELEVDRAVYACFEETKRHPGLALGHVGEDGRPARLEGNLSTRAAGRKRKRPLKQSSAVLPWEGC